MLRIVNIAAYRFASLESLPLLRRELYELCRQQQLKGTILLSSEGINLFLAGERSGIDALLDRIRRIPSLADLEVKESLSHERPFNRLLVKIKREIIPFGVENVDPRRYTSPRVSPRQLKEWLDQGRAITLLDTRNEFEVTAGTFQSAVSIGIDDFRDFPAAVRHLPDELKRGPVVAFCTGGIRCEKAAPYLESVGFQEVYQLDGGILKYFEECGGEHYRGDCFVFDKRVALAPSLEESGLRQCFVCQAILSAHDQASAKYVEGVSCPNCYRTETEQQAELLERRHAALRKAAAPLPGSVPYDNVRPISVPLRFDGLEALDFLEAMRTHLSREQWAEICRQGHLLCRGDAVQAGRIVRAGERLLHAMPATLEPDVNASIEIVHEDDLLLVVNKPAPLPAHPCGRFNRNTLTYLLAGVYAPLRLRPAHRLDADTSGIMVFSKTAQVARRLQPQFETGQVRKRYLARVQGHPQHDAFESHEPLEMVPGADGIRLPSAGGAAACTRFRTLKRLLDGTTLIEAEPLTGRTNQIRAHLWFLGLPILGDPMYLPDRRLGSAKTLSLSDPALCLHAASIELNHPASGQHCHYRAPAPAWSQHRPDRTSPRGGA
jgi:RluA family pseudouridine synthase